MARFQLIRAALAAALLSSPAYAQLGPRAVGPSVNTQTGTTYTVLNSDCGKLVTFSNGSAVAVTLPQAGAASQFAAQCEIRFANRGAGTVTVTPTTSTIDGQASVAIASGGGFTVNSSGGQWYTYGRAASAPSSGTVTSVATGAGLTGGTITATGTVAATTNTLTTAIVFVLDGGGSVLTTGVKGDVEIPFACTITAARLLADQSGSIVVDIWKDTYANFPPTDADSITSSAPPTISSATKAEDTTLTGWTTSITAGNILRFNVDSATTVTRVTVSLTCVKS
jgi:hypothetical protein